MTTQEFGELIEKDQTRAKMISALQRDFPNDREKAEDWTAAAILYGLRKSGQFKDETGALAYLMGVGQLIATKDKARDIKRREVLSGRSEAQTCKWEHRLGGLHDPMRNIDFKVDLEKAIKLTTGNKTMQQTLWHIHYEKWTWDEVLDALPKDILRDTWRKRIQRTNDELQGRLNTYGYRG